MQTAIKDKQTAPPDLKRAAATAKRIADEYRRLRHELSGVIKTTEGNHDLNLIELSDELNSLELLLKEKSDGRPQPLDFWEHDRCYMTEDKDFRKWASCWCPGPYKEKAKIGGVPCSMDDLKAIRDWINAVIKWHEKQPKPKKQTKNLN